MKTLKYPAIRSSQVNGGEQLVTFSAPAVEINQWSGIPQKKRLFVSESEQSSETVGFQRETTVRRVSKIASFMAEKSNTLQNPLLCALQQPAETTVRFVPLGEGRAEDRSSLGHVEIKVEALDDLPLLELIRRVKEQIENRQPKLKHEKISEALLTSLRTSDAESSKDDTDTGTQESDPEDDEIESAEDHDASDSSEPEVGDHTEAAFGEESHMSEFWQDLAVRAKLLEEMGDPANDRDHYHGYSKDAMKVYLQPVVVMDGQHRLLGALKAAKDISADVRFDQEKMDLKDQGKGDNEIEEMILARESRCLPISLLMSASPSEHVFQFVVVNQKATPIGKALLGTIVSTTLTNDEIQTVSHRLTEAGIELESSQAVSYLSRSPNSPFRDKVEQGLHSDSKKRLAYSVMKSLVNIFQRLEGGQRFGDSIDYAKTWREFMFQSAIVQDYAKRGFNTPYDYWSSIDGPWRMVFMAFFKQIRERFSSDDPASNAYWGDPTQSNLFNKISLTILSADFFDYLQAKEKSIDSEEHLGDHIENWLRKVDPSYFNRDWQLRNVKKDMPIVRIKWANNWHTYRVQGGRMPRNDTYAPK